MKSTPSRTPNAMWLPDRKKLRVDTSEESAVFQALKRGRCTLDANDLSVILDLSNRLTDALVFYVSSSTFAIEPSEFRREIQNLRTALEDFIAQYPPQGGVVEAAIAERLERDELHRDLAHWVDRNEREMRESPTLFLSRTRRWLELLGGVLADLSADESGRGRDSDRALDHLINALLGIYSDFTGARPGIGTTSPVNPDYLNPAERFVEAVVGPLNNMLPEDEKIQRPAIQYRVRRWVEINRSK